MREAEGLRLKAEGSQKRSTRDARHATLGTIRHIVTPSLRAPSRWTLPLSPPAFSLQPSAFTLIELVSVLAIVCVMLTVALGAYISWGRAGSLDAAANQLAAALDHARELAITQRLDTHVICTNTNFPGRPARGAYLITTNDFWVVPAVPVAPPGLLPPDVWLPGAAASPIAVTFLPDGTCDPVTNLVVAASSTGSALTPRIIQIQNWRLRVLPRGEQP